MKNTDTKRFIKCTAALLITIMMLAGLTAMALPESGLRYVLSASAANDVASGVCGDNLTWTFERVSNSEYNVGTLTISGTGPMYDYDNTVHDWDYNASSSNVAPWDSLPVSGYCDYKCVVVEEGVTSIGSRALQFFDSVSLPNTLTTIGDHAFENGTFSSINIPNGVTSIGENAFSDCSYLQTVTIPDSVISIGDCAFWNCENLTTVQISDNVQSIGRQAFDICNLSSINIPESLTYLGDDWANGCRMTSITIPDGLTYIASEMFYDWKNLASITIPDGVTRIEDYAFCGCESLASITIPNSVKSIEGEAFYKCNSLTDVYYDGSENEWNAITPNGYLPNTTIIHFAKENDPVILASGVCGDNLTWALYDDGTLRISGTGPMYKYYDYDEDGNWVSGEDANGHYPPWIEWCFDNGHLVPHGERGFYSDITNVIIEEGVTSICQSAFWDLNITSLSLPESLESIGDYAFKFSSLNSLYIPANVSSIGVGALGEDGEGAEANYNLWLEYRGRDFDEYYYDNLLDTTYVKNITVSPDNNYYTVRDGVLFTKDMKELVRCPSDKSGAYTIPDGVTLISPYAFSGCAGIESVTIPDSVAEIGAHAFADCGLTSLEIPDSVTMIHVGSISRCKELKTLTIGGGVATIEDVHIWELGSLETLIIREGVYTIGDFAFYGCDSLKTVYIPHSVETIEDAAFDNTSSLADVYYNGTEEEWNALSINNGYLLNANKHFVIGGKCGDNLTWKYDGVDTVTISGTGPMYDFYSDDEENYLVPPWLEADCQDGNQDIPIVTKVIVEEGVTSIGEAAFESRNTTSVTLPESLTSIGDWAFYACRLESLYIPSGVSYIGDRALGGDEWVPEDDSERTTVNNITVSPDNNYFTVQDGVLFTKDMKELVRCPSDKTGAYAIPDGVSEIRNSAFTGCRIESVTFPDSLTKIGKFAFINCELASVTIPDGVTAGYSAFAYSPLTEATVSGGATAMPGVFCHCPNLETVRFADGVKIISNSALYNCPSLRNVYIPHSMETIEADAFGECSALTDVYYDGTEEEWNNITIEDYNDSLLNANIHFIVGGKCGDNLTWRYNGTDTITISGTGPMYDFYSETGPDGLIPPWLEWCDEHGSYDECSRNVTKVIVEEGVTSIGFGAFEPHHITSVTLPESLTSIGDMAFLCCRLESLYIPSGVSYIGRRALAGDEWVPEDDAERSTVNNITVSPDNNYFTVQDGVLFTKDMKELVRCPSDKSGAYAIPDGVAEIRTSAFTGCRIGSVTIPDSVTKIGQFAFLNCELASVTIPDSVTTIVNGAFAFNPLTEAAVGGGVTAMPYAFNSCPDLETVRFADGAKIISDGAFGNCPSLRNVYIPYSMETIEAGAFDQCSALSDVYYDGTEEEWNGISIGDYNDYLLGATVHFIEPALDVSTRIQAAPRYTPDIGIVFSVKYEGSDAGNITDKAVAILDGYIYYDGMSNGDFVNAARDNGTLYTGSLGELGYNSAADCYTASVDGLTSADFDTPYYVLPCAVVNGRWTVYGDLKSTTFRDRISSQLSAAPANISAEVISASSVRISWDACANAMGYVIFRSVNDDSNFEEIGTTTALRYTDTDISPDTTYYYYAKPYMRIDGDRIDGKESEKVSVTTIHQEDFIDYSIIVTDTTAQIFWYPVEGAASYDIFRSANGETYTNLASVPAGAAVDYGDGEKYSYFDEELTIDKTYLYRIAARDENGRLIAESYEAEVTTKLPAPELSAAAASYNSVSLTWSTATDVTGYEIYRYTAGSDPVLVKKITKGTTYAYTDGSLQCGTDYIYYIRAYKTVNKVNYFSGESEYAQARPVPATPAKPAVTPNVSAGTIKLTWKTVAGAGGYEISRADSADGDYRLIGESGSPKTLTFTDGEIYDDNMYFYRVTAYVLSGSDRIYGEASDWVSSSLAIGAPSLRLVSSTYNSVKLGWDKVTGATGYEVWRAEDDGEFVKIATIGSGTTVTYNNTKLTTGTTYRYQILAFTLKNKQRIAESDFSNQLEATPSLTIPASLKVTRSSYTLKASWSAVAGAAGYELYRSVNGGEFRLIASTPAKTRTYTDIEVNRGIKYTYKVRAVAANAKGGFSEAVTMTPTLPAPGSFSAKASSYDTITLKWKKSAGATGYAVYRSTTKDGTYHLTGRVYGNDTVTYNDTTVDTGVTYYYVVKAMREFGGTTGYSQCSAIKSATTVLAKPTGLALTKSGTRNVKITWKASAGADGYEIYRSSSKNGTYTCIAAVTGTEYTDNSAKAAGTYYYRVKAYRDISGGTAYSDYVQKSIAVK